ncbi:MAG: DUF4019 domain-containing protein [Gammaproteobacteria bacterium]|nr:DUF4019 domain-containing protein [Gammaproteobacteria bacterium]
MKKIGLIIVFVNFILAPAFAQQGTDVQDAKQAAQDWLLLTDSRQYAASWEQSSSFFRAAITAEDWEQALHRARSAFGALLAREVGSSNYATTLPGAPDGEYVVFEFNSAFEDKAAAVETVTVMKDIDGRWRVGGYFIR